MTYTVTFDFESLGPIPSVNGFTRLGAVIGNLSTGGIVDVFDEYANQDGYIPDKQCIETFWMNNPEKYLETLDKCAASKHSPHEVLEMFVSWIQKFSETDVYVDTKDTYGLTDCSTYDSGMLKAFSLHDTLKMFKNSVRDTIDTTSFYLGIARVFMTGEVVDGNAFERARVALGLEEFKSSVEHDHNPVNDSIVIFEKYKYINDALLKD